MRSVSLAAGAALTLAVAGSAACAVGGASPATPAAVPTATPSPAAVAPEVRDGDTGAGVAAAVAAPTLVAPGAPVSVTAAGYLRRQQLFVAGTPVFLWPEDEDYVRAIVYAGGDFGLVKWGRGFTVKPWPGTEEKMAAAAAEASRVSGLAITLTNGTADVDVVYDPAEPLLADNALAVTSRTFSGYNIMHARIVFRSVGEFLGNSRQNGGRTNTAFHEMGHVLGLGHSIDYRDIMSQEDRRNPTGTYGRRETLALHMMYTYRDGGNFAPDRAYGVTGIASARPAPAVVVD
jgi:hypothetical protein